MGGTKGHNTKQNEPKTNMTCVLTRGVRGRKDRKVTEASRSVEGEEGLERAESGINMTRISLCKVPHFEEHILIKYSSSKETKL